MDHSISFCSHTPSTSQLNPNPVLIEQSKLSALPPENALKEELDQVEIELTEMLEWAMNQIEVVNDLLNSYDNLNKQLVLLFGTANNFLVQK